MNELPSKPFKHYASSHSALVIVLINVSFYANDGWKSAYIPKFRQIGRQIWRCKAWLTLLIAWTSKVIWRAIEGNVWKLKTKREFRWWLKIAHKYKANTRFNKKHTKYRWRQLRKWVYHDLIVQQAVMAMEAHENKTECEVIFDTNSKPVGIDNHASAYISGNIDDFDGELKETNWVNKGFSGTRTRNMFCCTAVLKADQRWQCQSPQGLLAKQLLCTQYKGMATLSTALVKRTLKTRQEGSS